MSFTTIWNYITLKRLSLPVLCRGCFTTIWNYITLKLWIFRPFRFRRFTTIWNYITLKQYFESSLSYQSFTTIWNYITLKHVDFCITIRGVLPLSGITSLSNMSLSTFFNLGFYHYLELHHSQTKKTEQKRTLWFYHYLELHHSQTG